MKLSSESFLLEQKKKKKKKDEFRCVLRNLQWTSWDGWLSSIKALLWNQNQWHLKMLGHSFQNLVFCFIWRIITPKMYISLKFQLKQSQAVWVYEAILYIAVAYNWAGLSVIMVTITRHVFINTFQTERFSAVKLVLCYEKNMSSFVIPKSPKVWQKCEKIGLGFFKDSKMDCA